MTDFRSPPPPPQPPPLPPGPPPVPPLPPPARPPSALREIRNGFAAIWWRFFDWLAVVSWKTLLLVRSWR